MRKHPQADLEQKRSTFFQLGLLVALALVLAAFQWTDYSRSFEWSVQSLDSELLTAETIQPTIRYQKPQEATAAVESKPIIDKFVVKADPGKKQDDNFNITWYDPSGFGDCFDCDLDDEEDLDLVYDASRIQIKPWYSDCENVLDYEEQSNCSYQKIRQFINDEAIYPEYSKRRGESGRVWVSFVVDKKGDITQVKLERGDYDSLNKAALKALRGVPSMNPAKQMGKAVSVRFMIPVDFKLQ
jgi:protein TonB